MSILMADGCPYFLAAILIRFALGEIENDGIAPSNRHERDALLQFGREHGQMLGIAIACERFFWRGFILSIP